MTAEPSGLQTMTEQGVAESAGKMMPPLRPVETSADWWRVPTIRPNVESTELGKSIVGQQKLSFDLLCPAFEKETVEQADRQLTREVPIATARERQVGGNLRQGYPSTGAELSIGQAFE